MTDYRLPTMNLWTDDDASMIEALMTSDPMSFWPPPSSLASTSNTAAAADPSKALNQPPPQPPQPQATALFSQESLQQRLQALIEGSRESWTYAIFWESSVVDYTGGSMLGWGNGYYKGEEDKGKRKTASSSSATEQEHRKKVLRELNSLISGASPSADDTVDEEVTDTEWFFLVSMTQSFANGSGLPDQALLNSSPIWVAGAERLVASPCKRARQSQVFRLQTMVCIPSANGVVEMGSTDLIFQSTDLMNKVRVLFNFNSIEMGSWSIPTDHGENDPSALYLTYPSSSVVELKDSVNTTTPATVIGSSNPQLSKQTTFENPSSSTLTENPIAIHVHNHNPQQQNHGQSFFTRELNFSEFGYDGSSIRNGNSLSYMRELGEIFNVGESKRSSSSANGNLFSCQSPFGSAEDNKKKRRSPTSRGSNEEGMLLFTSGVILPSSGVVKSSGGGGGGGGDSDHSDPEKRPQNRGEKPANGREEPFVAPARATAAVPISSVEGVMAPELRDLLASLGPRPSHKKKGTIKSSTVATIEVAAAASTISPLNLEPSSEAPTRSEVIILDTAPLVRERKKRRLINTAELEATKAKIVDSNAPPSSSLGLPVIDKEEKETKPEEYSVRPVICGRAMTVEDSVLGDAGIAVGALQALVTPADLKVLCSSASEDLVSGVTHAAMVAAVRSLEVTQRLVVLHEKYEKLLLEHEQTKELALKNDRDYKGLSKTLAGMKVLLSATQESYNEMEEEFNALKAKVDPLKTQLAETQKSASETQLVLESTSAKLKETSAKLKETSTKLKETSAKLEETSTNLTKLNSENDDKYIQGWDAAGDNYEAQVKLIAETVFQDGWFAALHRLRVDESSPLWKEIPSRAAAALEAVEENDGDICGDGEKIALEARKID